MSKEIYQPEPADAMTRALRLPLRALESRPISGFGENFAHLLLFIWRTFVPSVVREVLLRRVRVFMSQQSQFRFRLRTSPGIRYFDMNEADREVITADGVKLKCTHLWPKTGDSDHDHHVPLPVCIMRTIYSRRFDYPIARILAERGYHVLMMDSRGHFDSEGELNIGEHEARDAGCTMRWLSEQTWCDGRVFLLGISIGGYTSWAAAAGLLRTRHRQPLEELETQTNRKPLRVVAAFPLFSSSDIIKKGTFMDLDEARPDPVMRVDLATRYSTFVWNLANPKRIFGSHTLWVILTTMLWQINTGRASFLKRQMHLPLPELDIAACEEMPTPRMPFHLDPKHDFWQQIGHSQAPYDIGKGAAVGDVEGADPPAMFFASGWYDIFREQTMQDFQAAIAGLEEAKRTGQRGNELIYLMMGPWTHFNIESYFGPIMRECIRVLDHVFADLGREKHTEDPLSSAARVTAYCFGSGGFFFHRLPFYRKAAILVDPYNPFNIENDSNHCWRYYDSWPPRSSCPVYFALQPRGRLRLSSGPVEVLDEGTDSLVWDPSSPTPTIGGGAMFGAFNSGPMDNRPLEARPDTLVYTSPMNESTYAVEFAGQVKLRVWAYSTAISADVFARMTLVDPRNGESITLCDGIRRITLKNGVDEWPRLFEVDLGHFCGSIEPKWRIRLVLAGGSFPQFSRNLGFGEDATVAVKSTKATHRISFKEHDQYSELEVPIIGGVESALSAFSPRTK